MNFERISIDITRILKRSDEIRNLIFEVALLGRWRRGSQVIYFCEIAEWNPTTLLERKDGAGYANKSDSRRGSLSTAVFYITISSLQNLHVYSPGVFSQMLSIQ
jgi:hypothetical protein